MFSKLKSLKVKSFLEKPDGDGNWINAGFFVCEPSVFDYIPKNDDTVVFEKKPLEDIAKEVSAKTEELRQLKENEKTT